MGINKVRYWHELADYDIESAEVMFRGGKWIYVAFMCHQAIEKAIKSHWCAVKKEDVPYLHNLMKLAQSCGLLTKMTSEQQNLMAELMPMNIECRYPTYKESLASVLTEDYCKDLLDRTIELKLWIESKH